FFLHQVRAACGSGLLNWRSVKCLTAEINHPLPQVVLTVCFHRILHKRHHATLDLIEVSFQGAAGSIAMAAPTKLLGDPGDVHFAFRTEAGAINTRRTLFEK